MVLLNQGKMDKLLDINPLITPLKGTLKHIKECKLNQSPLRETLIVSE